MNKVQIKNHLSTKTKKQLSVVAKKFAIPYSSMLKEELIDELAVTLLSAEISDEIQELDITIINALCCTNDIMEEIALSELEQPVIINQEDFDTTGKAFDSDKYKNEGEELNMKVQTINTDNISFINSRLYPMISAIKKEHNYKLSPFEALKLAVTKANQLPRLNDIMFVMTYGIEKAEAFCEDIDQKELIAKYNANEKAKSDNYMMNKMIGEKPSEKQISSLTTVVAELEGNSSIAIAHKDTLKKLNDLLWDIEANQWTFKCAIDKAYSLKALLPPTEKQLGTIENMNRLGFKSGVIKTFGEASAFISEHYSEYMKKHIYNELTSFGVSTEVKTTIDSFSDERVKTLANIVKNDKACLQLAFKLTGKNIWQLADYISKLTPIQKNNLSNACLSKEFDNVNNILKDLQ